MSTEAELLAAICAHPEEDTPRLAFADFLDERAEGSDADRAAFIRLQCEADRLEKTVRWEPQDPAAAARRKELNDRAGQLFKKHRKEWEAPLRGRKGPARGRFGGVHFRRGFPEKAWAPAAQLVAEGEKLLRLAPITYLNPTELTDELLAELVRKPWLSRVRRLTLEAAYAGGATRPDFSRLADAELPLAEYFWLARGTLDAAGAARLAKAAFPALRQFLMCDTEAGGHLGVLFAGRWAKRVEEVYFNRCGVGSARVRELAGLPKLRKLSLPGHGLTPDDITALTRGKAWRSLRELCLYSCSLDPAGAAALAAAKPGGLKALDLKWNPLGDLGIFRLVGSRVVGNLYELEVSGCGFATPGFAAVAHSPHLAGLRRLLAWGNTLSPAAADELADSPHLAGLEYLSLSRVQGAARRRLADRFGDRVSF